MLELAAGTNPDLFPSIIAASASIFSALVLGWFALKAQSAKQQLEEIRKLGDFFSEELYDRIAKRLDEILNTRTRGLWMGAIVKRALREVFDEERGRRPGRRRTDDENDD